MSGGHFSKYAKAKRRRPPAPTPGKVLSAGERAALLASRPDLQQPGSRAHARDRDDDPPPT